ncbi:MAG: 50S ribosomal protein L17 [Candidatus Pacebacteria bacterium CG_4_10_14_3_um_filter_34_15]|nr:50S ribosomal protein L17 [Candidatus Pacearchaeota archaeon]NCQ65274.1 50S ribosomal protein L17 [Candidatus Paceibacterota bacterium]OIO45002.1 MAG: 50S ribosomal protein L17 [Candidatus Pacebacteria bacterium CG1_02_43_31]PIQ81053.1 MAG: 50S ribosomal protein L17 [Candidatus Pacebacteria bacterium CG11_big_fil_rev_8_21_14_0_20_34_55]PIX81870.1 MAG: 50S ribosomal protein L17 [Candidatus Pacebacteria bacterium CG_4_10_14_3_um_filter_34_15]PJC44085.1 MAG: 50S ribosomal protein L17 [Candidat
MRHRVKIKHFNRDSKARKALFKGLVRSLVEHGSIVTTENKAKEIKRIADKIISKAKVDTLATRRLLHKFFGRRDVVNSLVDRIAPEFSDKNSGFTTIEDAGLRRGDNTKLSKLSLTKVPSRIGTLKAEKKPAEKVAKKPVAKKTVAKKAVAKKTVAKKAPTKKAVATKKKSKKEIK